MNTAITTLGMVSILIQLGIAVYALRLNRLFGTRRVGWSLCVAFIMMALLHAIEAADPGFFQDKRAVLGEAALLGISLLLLAGLIHIGTLTREILRSQERERQWRAELEVEIQRRTVYLLKSLDGLQAEMEERKHIEREIRLLKNNWPATANATGLKSDLNSVYLGG